MIITGTKFRSFASQNIFSYNINGNINNTTGNCSIWFSGTRNNGVSAGIPLFRFIDGKVYDSQNFHVWSYNPNENFNISGNINTGDHNYYINNKIIENSIFLNPPNIYSNSIYFNASGCSIDFDLNIIGARAPDYNIVFPFQNIIGNNITGLIYNNSNILDASFQIFTGQIFESPYYSILALPTNFISGGRSGQLIFNYSSPIDPNIFSTGIGTYDTLNASLALNTNFGNIIYDINTPVDKRSYYYIELIELFRGLLQNTVLNYPYYQYDYDLRTLSDQNQNVTVTLNNILGHNNNLYYEDFLFTGNTPAAQISGFIQGNDYVTGSYPVLLTSTTSSYSGLLNNNFLFTKTIFEYATGTVNYFFNIPIEGGSGFAPVTPDISVPGTGFIFPPGVLSNNFIYGSRLITGGQSGLLTGNFLGSIQTGSGFMIASQLNYFTGNTVLNYNNLFWSTIPYIGYDIEEYDNNYKNKIYGITGSGIITFTGIDSGVKINQIVFTNQNTGIFLKNIINTGSEYMNDKVFGSETFNLEYVFSNDSFGQWGTASDISTGYLGVNFTSFPLEIISHYEIILDKNFSNYKFLPVNFSLQGSSNFVDWFNIDTRSNVNFYEPFNIFTVTNPANYDYVRLLITGQQSNLQHINENLINDYQYGLSINKINFYTPIMNIITGSGLYRNFLDNNIPSASFNGGFMSEKGSFDFIFNDDNTTPDISYYVTNLDKSTYPALAMTGLRLYYYTPFPYTGYTITGFYTRFDDLSYNLPYSVSIQATTDIFGQTGWQTVYLNKSPQRVESGFLNPGLIISPATPYRYFALNLGLGYGEINENCTSGWRPSNKFLITGLIRDMDVSNDGQRLYLVSHSYTGNGPYTGVIWHISNEYSQGYSGINFTGSNIENVQLERIVFAKNNENFILTTTSGVNESRVFLSRSSGKNISYDSFILNRLITGGAQSAACNVSGNIIMLGNTPFSRGSGSLMIYTGNNSASLNLRQQLTGGNASGFGASVACDINANIIAVGAPNSLLNTGLVNIYTGNSTNGWIFRQSLTGGNIGGSMRLGSSVAMNGDGNIIIVGGPNANINTGLCMIYTGNSTNGWIFRQRISGLLNQPNSFGNSLATNENGNIIFIGASGSNLRTGVVEIFTGNAINSWQRHQILSGLNSGAFGASVSDNLNGNILVVGSPTSNRNSGQFLIYTGNIPGNWLLRQSISGNRTGQFGITVSTNTGGNIIAIGNPLNNLSSGTVFIYTGNPINQWRFFQEINNTGNRGEFGRSIAINSGNILAIGAPLNIPSGALIYNFNNITENFVQVGLTGSWLDVAISNNARVMIAVGNGGAQYSTNSGQNWSRINDLDGLNLTSVAISSGGDQMYCMETVPAQVWRSQDGGISWGVIHQFPGFKFTDIDTSDNGQYVSVGLSDPVFQDYFIEYSTNNGDNWGFDQISQEPQRIRMSRNGQYQLAITENQIRRSTNFGQNWASLLTEVSNINATTLGISSGGQFQFIGGLSTLQTNCTFGNSSPDLFQEVGIEKFNLYAVRNNNFFESKIDNFFGYGRVNSFVSGSGFGNLFNLTGNFFQPAIFYQTGLLTGTTSNGFFTWFNINISGTGAPGRVFLKNITGTRPATGIIFINTGLLSIDDGIIINNTYFQYTTGTPISNYYFNNLSGLINVLNSGASGLLDENLEIDVGVTGYVLPSQNGIVLFSYYLSGDDGNQVRLRRYFNNLEISNPSSIIIPSRYLQSGQFLRLPINQWVGQFSQNFSLLSFENTGIYTFDIDSEFLSKTDSGVIFENNFDRNWSINITPISQGVPLNSSLTTTLTYFPSNQTFSGSFNIISGLGFLGYSGLNFNFQKRTYINPSNIGNLARYIISGQRFSFTGVLEG